MLRLIVTPIFKRAYKKFIRSYPYLQFNIEHTIETLEDNPFTPEIVTHKLSGDLFELYACKCGYDCRIIFSIDEIPPDNEKVITLIDIGTHENVY